MERISKKSDSISCLAIRTKDVLQKNLNAERYVSGLNAQLNQISDTSGDVNPLGHYIDINPKVSINDMDPQTCVSFIGMGNIESDATGEYETTSKPLHNVRGSGYTRFEDGDILWAKLDQSMQNGKSCLVNNLKNGIGFGSTEFHVIRVKDNSLSPKFLLDFLGRESFRRMASGHFTGSSRLRVCPEFLTTFPFPVLSKDKQKKIVAKMEKSREQRKAKLMKANALLSNIDFFILDSFGITPPSEDSRKVFSIRKKSIKHRFDCRFYRPHFMQIENMLSKIQSVPLGDLLSFSQETWNPKTEKNKNFRYIEISSVCRKTGLASWQEIPTQEAPSRARMKIRKNDIIVSLTRPHHGSIAHLGGEFEGCVASTGFAVIRDVTEHITREYLWLILRTHFSLAQMFRHASGGNYPAITQPELKKIIIPVPDKELQTAIVTGVQKYHTKAIRLQEEAKQIWQNAKQWFEEQLMLG